MATIAQPRESTFMNSNIVDTHIYFYQDLLYDEDEEFVGRGHGSTPLTPDPNKLYQRVVTKAEYVDNRKYQNRLFENEIVEGENGKFYKVKKDIDISYDADGTADLSSWLSYTASMTTTDATWTEDSIDYTRKKNVWVQDGTTFNNYKVTTKLVDGEDVEVARELFDSIPQFPTKILDELPKLSERWMAIGWTDTFHAIANYNTTPFLPAFTDTSYYEELPEYIISFYYVRPIEPYLMIDANNTTSVSDNNSVYISLNPTEDFNSFTISEIIGNSYSYNIYTTSGTILSDDIPIDCKIDEDGLLGLKPITKLVKLDRTYTADEVTQILITVRNNIVDDYYVEVGNVNLNMAVDEGVTEFEVTASVRDYNNYTPNVWGEIEEAVKPIRRTFDISVAVSVENFDKTYNRHRSLLGQTITLDGTDVCLGNGGLDSLTARGIITSISHATTSSNNKLDNVYKYKMSFLEVV